MHYVYILQSIRTREFYKGLTVDIDKRLNQHSKRRVKSTRNKLPLKLMHVEVCLDRKEARRLEKFFKTGYGREIIEEIAEVAER